MVKKMLPTVPPLPKKSSKKCYLQFLLFPRPFSKKNLREGKGCGRRKKPKVGKSPICLQNHVQHLLSHKVE
jgi:hypothetical protein